ncbi:MAG: tetratricopeptide repeat protein [Planctomycetota bacterium]|nr:MAG: tetratricopeptide repeat protein [Planctomycetota bacterium]
MDDTLSEIRQRIRAIIDKEQAPVFELGRIVTGNESFETALQAAELERKKEKDPSKRAVLSNLAATIHLVKGRYAEAEKEALKSAEKKGLPGRIRALAYNLVTISYQNRGEFASAEEYCKKALGLSEEDDPVVLGRILNITGLIHMQRRKYALALEYFQSYRKTADRMGSRRQVVVALINMADALCYTDQEKERHQSLLEARDIAVEIGDKLRIGTTLLGLGNYYIDHGDLTRALSMFQEARSHFEKTSYTLLYATCHADLARTYLGMGDTDNAARHAADALAYAQEFQQKEHLPEAHKILGLVLAAQNNPAARNHFAESIRLYRDLEPEGNAEGIEFASLEFGKYLHRQNEPEGVELVRQANGILRKQPRSIRVSKALAEIEQILKVAPADRRLLQQERIDEIEKHRDNLNRVLEITKAINAETEMEGVLERILDIAIDTSGAERGFIVLIRNGKWKFAVQRNFVADVTAEPDYPVMHEIVAKAISDRAAFTAGNVQQSEILQPVISSHPCALKGVVAFPLAMKDRVIGSVYLDSRYAVVDLPRDELFFMEILMGQVALIVEKTRLYEEVRALSEKRGEKLEQTLSELVQKQQELELRFSYKNIIGKSPKMQELFRLLDKVIESDLPVYIYGASGTGKELIARAIHYNGPRKNTQFVALNCGTIQESLLESELFGYEKGAFTGADTTKKGLFEIASGGTFFLDEIGNMDKSMQQKLLRVLQEKEIRRIGGRKPIRINVRIISASNISPSELIETGQLREDLFYRLRVLMIDLPSLRERKEDIPLLVEHFWEKATNSSLDASGDEKRKLLKALMNYDWPGNVRELENEIYRLALLGDGSLNVNHLSRQVLNHSAPEQVPGFAATFSLKVTEKALISAALLEAKGNKSRAARLLGIPRTSLRDKIKKYGLQSHNALS